MPGLHWPGSHAALGIFGAEGSTFTKEKIALEKFWEKLYRGRLERTGRMRFLLPPQPGEAVPDRGFEHTF
jgi:hypothetical protein